MSIALALVVVVAALNPMRRRHELGSAPGPGPIALGALLAGGVFVGVAAVSGPVLEGLAVSGPNIRIAAGVVLGLKAVADLVSAPRVESATWPRREALVPVAFPVLIRPEVAILALAVGSEVGIAASGWVALASFGAAAAALVALPASGTVRHGGALVSAVAVAVAVNVIVAGVLDV